jgi:LytS/YehU family sensor histidine kinase
MNQFPSPERPFQRPAQPPEPGSQKKPVPPHRPPAKGMPVKLSFILISILMLGFQTGLAVTFRWMDSERKRIKSEKESISNQLAFLRNQVSPHFFMNTLNNIHSLVDIDRNKAKGSIIQLSKMMRHLLYDAEVELIPLSKELEFITNYVDLMKLRFGEHVKVTLNIPGNHNQIEIPPLLFTSLIENAFKYGVSASEPSFVNIDFTLEPSWLILNCENSNFVGKQEQESTGIGIANVRKRLDLLYGKDYKINISDQNDKFFVELKIPL